MTATVDRFDSLDGWTPSALTGSVASALNDHREFISGLNAKSIVFSFPGGVGQYIEKAIDFDFTPYDEVTFSIWSRRKRGSGVQMKDSADFAYKIGFGGPVDYYIPIPKNGMDDVTISAEGIGAVKKIRITALTGDADCLIISNMVASRDEMPLDIYRGLKDQIQAHIDAFCAKTSVISGDWALISPQINGKGSNLASVGTDGIMSGTGLNLATAAIVARGLPLGNRVTGAVGDKSVVFDDSSEFIAKYTVIRIDDGQNSEVHQLGANDEMGFTFLTTYDGSALKNSYTAASVYLMLPVEYGLSEREIILPGIVIGGMEDEELNRTTKLETVLDTFMTDGTVRSRRVPVNYRYSITIDCEGRQDSIVRIMAKLVKIVIAKEYFWVNGRMVNIRNPQRGVYVPAVEAFNEIPKMHYAFNVELKEDVEDRDTNYPTVSVKTNFNLQTGQVSFG